MTISTIPPRPLSGLEPSRKDDQHDPTEGGYRNPNEAADEECQEQTRADECPSYCYHCSPGVIKGGLPLPFVPSVARRGPWSPPNPRATPAPAQ